VPLYKLPAIITTGKNKKNNSLSAKKTILPKQILPPKKIDKQKRNR
jgi:hypothetical protein